MDKPSIIFELDTDDFDEIEKLRKSVIEVANNSRNSAIDDVMELIDKTEMLDYGLISPNELKIRLLEMKK